MDLSSQEHHPNRLIWADFVRITGIFLVILGHVTAIPMIKLPVTSVDWMFANIYNTFARVCVPVLFMLSGSLLLPKQETLVDFYVKRFQKVAIPFLIWSFLYLYAAKYFSDASLLGVFKIYIREMSVHPVEYHLWFMYDLFLLYILTPIFRVFAQNASREVLWYFMLVWFIFGPLQSQVERMAGFDLAVDLGYLIGFPGYFILGYILNQIVITRKLTWGIVIIYIASGVYTIWAIYSSSLNLKQLDAYYQSLTGWNIALLSVSFYLLLKMIGATLFSRSRPRMEMWIQNLAASSFGIYLIHIFVLRFLTHPFIPFFMGLRKAISTYALDPMASPGVLMYPVNTLVIFLISWVVIALIRKVPYLRYIT